MSFNKKPKTINPNEVDPSVYYYDEVYDEMKDEEEIKSTNDRDRVKGKDKSSKYIQGLLETAELRKNEKELRKFKRNIKDREEAEKSGDFREEDVYVTSTYEKKVREYKEMEKEKMKRLEQEKNNSMNFVKKQTIDKSDNLKPNDETNNLSTIDLDHHENQKSHKLASTTSPDVVKTTVNSNTPKTIVKRSLSSVKDRKEYLRKLLAKKTIGKVYEDAIQRYLERRCRSQ